MTREGRNGHGYKVKRIRLEINAFYLKGETRNRLVQVVPILFLAYFDFSQDFMRHCENAIYFGRQCKTLQLGSARHKNCCTDYCFKEHTRDLLIPLLEMKISWHVQFKENSEKVWPDSFYSAIFGSKKALYSFLKLVREILPNCMNVTCCKVTEIQETLQLMPTRFLTKLLHEFRQKTISPYKWFIKQKTG